VPLSKPMRLEQETSTSDDARARWDIFSAVVDNYGDIGVCWRLARQLTAEHHLYVRLWTDSLTSFQKICSEIDPLSPIQYSRGVEIRQWTDALADVEPADVVIEAFGCKLPTAYVEAMATKNDRRRVWINLEYLSAEEWVDSHHGLVSPHPQLPLTKHFFFPGFSSGTGGLLAENGLSNRRRDFQSNARLKDEFWREIDLPAPEKEETRISLFCYENKAVSNLFSGWAEAETPVVCIVPEGIATKQIELFFGHPHLVPGNFFKKGRLMVWVLPFLEQDTYDKLLWACDFNFVRGEDSFVRAQLAARPMAWQIYPQQEGAHWPKLKSFLGRYCVGLSRGVAEMLREFTEKWNRGEAGGMDWKNLWAHRAELENHARDWAGKLAEKEDLATNLVKFCNSKLK